MSTITRELAKLFRKITNSEIDAEGNAHVVLSPADSLLINNARIALASLEAEPVAWLLSGGGAKNHVSFDSGNAYADPLREVTPLYRHPQPAPVVPEEMTIRDACKFVQDMRLFDDVSVIVMRTWNACRAAMLAAAPQSPGSEPATVPGKWIPVSERMPIEFEAVIAFDGDQVYGEAMYSSDDGFTIDGYEPCDRLNLQNVTHWMPLPAAPQEVKGE